jgi:hypothetical protein
VTDGAPEPGLDVIAAHRARKAERDAPLLAKLLGTPATDADVDPAQERVQRAVAELEEAVAALEAGESEPEPEPTFLDGVATAQAARKRALVDALSGRAPQPRDERGRFTTSGLDGGARQTPERPPTHEQVLARLLRSGEADVGASL